MNTINIFCYRNAIGDEGVFAITDSFSRHSITSLKLNLEKFFNF